MTNETVNSTDMTVASNDQGATPATADTAATGGTDTADQAGGNDTPSTEKPASDAATALVPVPDQGATPDSDVAPTTALLDALHNAASTTPGTPAGDAATAALTAAVEAATSAPVDPAKLVGGKPVTVPVIKVPPTKAKGESNKAFNKRLAGWYKANPDYKAPAKGASDQGKPATPATPADQGKPANEPAAKPDNKPATVEPAKPAKPLTKAAALAVNASVDMPGGYDFSRWPSWFNGMKISHEAILAARAFNLFGDASKNVLAIAATLEQGRPENFDPATGRVFNVFDWGYAYTTLPQHSHTKPDNKQNAPLKAADSGLMYLDRGLRMPGQNPASTVGQGSARVVYRSTGLTSKGLKLVEAYFNARGLKVPLWLSDHSAAMAEYEAAKVKAAQAAEREARKAARANS
jgi:hypothetical protein